MTVPPATATWADRYRAGRLTLPVAAAGAPHRCVHAATSPAGTMQLHATDRRTGRTRQLTDEPAGVARGWPDRTGRHVVWFAAGAAETGCWRGVPFDGGEPVDLATADRARAAGVAMRGDRAVLGLAVPGQTLLVEVDPTGDAPAGEPLRLPAGTRLVGASADGRLLAVDEPDGGDPRRPLVRVLDADTGAEVARLGCGAGVDEPLHAVGFGPLPGDRRLLATSERDGRAAPLVWDVGTGAVTRPPVPLSGELRVGWYPDGDALLVCAVGRGRSGLARFDLDPPALGPPLTPPGFVRDAAVRADGSVEYLWSSSECPPRLVSTTAGVLLEVPGSPPGSVPCVDVEADGPGGRVHALLSVPEGGAAPYPTVFVLHGGPATFDSDSFNPYAAAWVDHGLAVVRVNYRGSTGYGRAWRAAAGPAAGQHVGWAELDDVDAVRRTLVARGVADPGRLVVAGASWGGYLALLALGRQPDVWAAGVAEAPIADYALAYELETEPLRALDRAVFGGTPDEVPDRWRASSPLTYADAVRAPLLVLAAEDDPRCPFPQVDGYVRRLAGRGAPVELYRYRAGHGARDVRERIGQVRRQLDFVTSRLGLPGPR